MNRPATLTLLAGLLLFAQALVAGGPSSRSSDGAAAEEPDGTIATEGRALYQGQRPFAAGRAATANRLPVEYAACAACHGALAEGRREGASVVPPIAWAALVRPRGEAPAYSSATAVVAAISAGTGRGDRPLDPAMPRYRLQPAETQALLAHLRRAGTTADRPPGVAEASIAFGSVLPLSGPAAASGAAIRAGLEEIFAEANATGGVAGRQLLLQVEDGAAAGGAAALRRLLRRPVHAIVGGLWVPDPEADVLLAAAGVAQIGGLVPRQRDAEAAALAVDLLAPRADQQAALVAAMAACDRPGPRLAVPILDDPMPAPGVRWLKDAAALQAAAAAGEGGCLGSGLAQASGVVQPGWRWTVVLPFPPALLEPGPQGQRADPWRRLGQAAARLAVEALARAGAVLSERSLLAQLASSPGAAAFGLLPDAPARFGPVRRHAWDPGLLELVGPPHHAAINDRGG